MNRRKLTKSQRMELSLVHHVALDAIARGEASPAVLQQWKGACYTWLRVAQLLRVRVAEMQEQLSLCGELEPEAAPSAAEYDCLKKGIECMDRLANLTDLATAQRAVDWSERQILMAQNA